jgi:DNA-directed RNA polymerase subunit E'/Rpb7
MFFLKELEKTIQLHPSYFGPLIRQHIHRELLQKEEGSSTGKYTIVCILDSFDISDGKVMPGSGSAEYVVHYKAVVWRPYKGEVVCDMCLKCMSCIRANSRQDGRHSHISTSHGLFRGLRLSAGFRGS